jgi:hypothetical protein
MFGMIGLLLLSLTFILPDTAQAGRIEGTVSYYAPDGKYGHANGATVEVVNSSTGRVYMRSSADQRGAYTAFAPNGSHYVRATFTYKGRRLTGSTCCVNFHNGPYGQDARGFNIAVWGANLNIPPYLGPIR